MTLEQAIKAVKDEPELHGQMPDVLKLYDPEELCRAVVRATKRSIIERLNKIEK